MKKDSGKSSNVRKMVLASILLAFAIILQLIGRIFVQINPLLIGPFISTIILLTTYYCGLTYGLLVSILIPVTAIPIGALATLLIPFAPFIVIGNMVFSAGFAVLMKKGKYGLYLGVVFSSIVKFLVLSISATKLIYVFSSGISDESAKMIGTAFTTPQLILALLGGAIAIILIKLLKKKKIVPIE